MTDVVKPKETAVEAKERRAYAPPQLWDVGELSSLTQSNGNELGADGIYS